MRLRAERTEIVGSQQGPVEQRCKLLEAHGALNAVCLPTETQGMQDKRTSSEQNDVADAHASQQGAPCAWPASS